MITNICYTLCRDCVYYYIYDDLAYCRYDSFNRVLIKTSLLFTPIDFDCINYSEVLDEEEIIKEEINDDEIINEENI